MNFFRYQFFAFVALNTMVCTLSYPQSMLIQSQEADPCGYPDTTMAFFKHTASIGWGYGYDTLRFDLKQWEKNPFVTIDSVGATVQGRTMFLMTIQDTATIGHPRKRIWIHARTHPGEVQGTWVTNEIVKTILSDTPLGNRLRDSCIFNIMPMYNPDGVELGYARENANGVDIESNWNTNPSQPEVTVLRNTFTKLMAEPNPIRIALNMHSAVGKYRYFVYHAATGTSALYSSIEIGFIDTVRYNFPNGISPYTYFVSWTTAAATQYPESWFWYNYKENVIALTYEDMNDASANSFDTTARAICRGIADQLGIFSVPTIVAEGKDVPVNYGLQQNYPNPFNPSTTISYVIPKAGNVMVKIYDALGREVRTLIDEYKQSGSHTVTFNAERIAGGVYFYRLLSGSYSSAKKMVLLK